MHNQLHTQRLAAIAVLIIALVILTMTQSSSSFLFVLPILLLTFGVSWYLYKEIQKEHEEDLKRSIRYIKEEKEAQIWLHDSFIPKVKTLAKKEMRMIILTNGIVLM